MLVKELIAALSELDGDLQIIMGSDDEGNDFINPYFPSESWAVKDDGYRCGLYPMDEDDAMEYDEEDRVKVVIM